MRNDRTPKRIAAVRRLSVLDLWDVNRFHILEKVRVLRKWLADPAVLGDMRQGDAELLAALPAHLAQRPPPHVHIVMREELNIENAVREAAGQTRH